MLQIARPACRGSKQPCGSPPGHADRVAVVHHHRLDAVSIEGAAGISPCHPSPAATADCRRRHVPSSAAPPAAPWAGSVIAEKSAASFWCSQWKIFFARRRLPQFLRRGGLFQRKGRNALLASLCHNLSVVAIKNRARRLYFRLVRSTQCGNKNLSGPACWASGDMGSSSSAPEGVQHKHCLKLRPCGLKCLYSLIGFPSSTVQWK